eukprot:31913-Prorocentrum_minimum.AAC.1
MLADTPHARVEFLPVVVAGLAVRAALRVGQSAPHLVAQIHGHRVPDKGQAVTSQAPHPPLLPEAAVPETAI